jgi:hypothetical protein
MVVGERPTMRNSAGPSDRLLYGTLEKCGILDAHLTDLIKTRGRAKERYPDDLEPHRCVFDREIEIIKPRLIITLGGKVYDLLQFYLAGRRIGGRRIHLEPISHYSYAVRWGKSAQFENEMQEAINRNK